MATLDWIFAAGLLISLLLGAWRGLVFELFSLAGWVAAYFVARLFGAELGALLPLGEAQAAWRSPLGFALAFVLTVFACGLVAGLARKLMTAAGLRPADRALGALFGVVRGVLLLLLVVWAARFTPVRDAPWWRQSVAVPLLEGAVQAWAPALPQDWAQRPA